MADTTLAPPYSFEGAGGLAPQPFWPLAAGTGSLLQPPVAMVIPLHRVSCTLLTQISTRARIQCAVTLCLILLTILACNAYFFYTALLHLTLPYLTLHCPCTSKHAMHTSFTLHCYTLPYLTLHFVPLYLQACDAYFFYTALSLYLQACALTT